MNENLITFEASSPEELKEVLEKLSHKDTRRCLYCALAISDPKFLLYPFNFKNTSRIDAVKQVTDEIAAIYELPLSDIDYDLQIFDQEENYLSGACAAMPKKHLHQYLDIMDSYRLVPLRIIPYCSAIIDYYFHLHNDPNVKFAIVDFSKKYTVSVAVFKNNRCQFIRQTPYERLHDVISEITESMKNACILSGIVQLDRIHFVGYLEDKMDIVADIEMAFKAKTERDQSVDIVTALSTDDFYFQINLARRYAFSDIERTKAGHLIYLLIILGGLFVIYLSSEIFFKIRELNKLNASYKLSEYDYARNLKQEMDSF